jgi:hypothetical protein
MDNSIKIPFYISRWGLISGQLFAINSTICFMRNYKILSYFLASLYITTILHWKKLKRNGIIRILDIIFAIITIIRITFFDSNSFITNYKTIWNIYIASSCCIFVMNEMFLYHNMVLNVAIHLAFLHIVPNLLCIYFVIMVPV